MSEKEANTPEQKEDKLPHEKVADSALIIAEDFDLDEEAASALRKFSHLNYVIDQMQVDFYFLSKPKMSYPTSQKDLDGNTKYISIDRKNYFNLRRLLLIESSDIYTSELNSSDATRKAARIVTRLARDQIVGNTGGERF